MPLSERIRNALSMTQLHSSALSTSSASDVDYSPQSSPTSSPIKYRQRTMTGTSNSSTSSIIAAPVLCLKKTLSDIKGVVRRRREERYREALALWAVADEREWEYPTWGGPAKKSRKYSREQRDSLRSWSWEKSHPNNPLEYRSRHSSMYSCVSPGTSPNNSFYLSHVTFEQDYGAAGRRQSRHYSRHYSTFKPSSRAERSCTVYGL